MITCFIYSETSFENTPVFMKKLYSDAGKELSVKLIYVIYMYLSLSTMKLGLKQSTGTAAFCRSGEIQNKAYIFTAYLIFC